MSRRHRQKHVIGQVTFNRVVEFMGKWMLANHERSSASIGGEVQLAENEETVALGNCFGARSGNHNVGTVVTREFPPYTGHRKETFYFLFQFLGTKLHP